MTRNVPEPIEPPGREGLALIDDCFRLDQPRLSHDEAVRLLSRPTDRVLPTEIVAVDAAIGRYLAVDIVADQPVPAHTNSAVDGYAFKAPSPATSLAVAGRATAGHAFAGPIPDRAAARVFTGAVLPTGTDTVAMQEEVRGDPADPERVILPTGLKRGANVRKAGEDIEAGRTVLERGHRLRPQDLAALAALGLDRVAVARRPRVAIVSTGDEVVAAGQGPLRHGAVFDANSAMLAALATAAGAECRTLGIWPDRRDVVTTRLAEAAADADLILTSGGASKGDEDHMAAAVELLGSRHFWQIAVKPGRPLLFGQIARDSGRTLIVGLPGNPVAVFVCAALYVQPLLRALQGGHPLEPRRWRLPAAFRFTGRKPGRREFWRGTLIETPTGLAVDKFARDGSGLISGLMAADGLIDVAEQAGDVEPGDLVDFIPLSEFGIARS